ncbi:Contactin-associated protein like 5-1 [Apodemus speciosus]|uniref:Contactin-associated protein like 5-1 n=1 Tax=Apodemus speciosus TaxID=105296 RepID=A0ABQ0FPX4_APOSI
MTFLGNMNADRVVHHKLLHSVRARFVRFVPIEWNPNGKIGMRVEAYGCSYRSDVADFNGWSSLLYRFNQKTMSTFKDVISLKFKSMQRDGVLFHGEGQRGDHITLELQKGRLALYLNLDDSKAQVSSNVPLVILGSLLDDQHWHSVLLERVGKQANFTVDMNTQHFQTKGETDALDIDYELSFGGIPVPTKPGTFLKKNFHGCIENLYYNGVNIIDLAKRRKHQIYSVGNVTFSCSEPQIVPITFVNSRSSYLLLPGTPQIDGLSVSFQFRTWNEEGLLLSTELSESSGTLLLIMEGGTLRLLIKKVAGQGTEIITGSGLNDGQWHSVSINARRNRVTLTLDNDAASPAPATSWLQIYSGSSYYFGGCPDNLTDSQCLNPIKAFQGCMRLIFIDNQPKDLISVQQGSLGSFSDLHIDLCSITDRCLPNYCEHGGHSTCHNSIYEQSCEVYRHRGNMAGFFYVDPDGSGPLGPLQVFCNITEDKIWMTVQHNNTELARIQRSNPEKPYAMTLNYGGSLEQLEALIDSSEHCEQEVTYYCKRSHLLNTPDGVPLTWWIRRANEKHPSWGGSVPGVQQCRCGLEESCLDSRPFCNCDAGTDKWRGTSSRQKGFFGCIRSLHLNGQNIDLEERAKVTSEVRPGCPGHCSSYGRNCHNGGKCVEKHSGYSCDCTNSPYEGPFCKTGSLQIHYRISKEESHVFTVSTENLANRRVHQVKMCRDGPELSIQTLWLDPEVARANTLGFVGCLSSVQYNHVAPLKAAFRHPSISPVTVRRTLTESSCGSMGDSDVNAVTTVHSSTDPFGTRDEHELFTHTVQSDSTVIGGVIAVVTFVSFCVIGIMIHFLYQHKQSHHGSQTKEKECPEGLNSSFINGIDLQNKTSQCKQEYFI